MTHIAAPRHAEDDFQKGLDAIFENQSHRMIVVDDDNRIPDVIIPTDVIPYIDYSKRSAKTVKRVSLLMMRTRKYFDAG